MKDLTGKISPWQTDIETLKEILVSESRIYCTPGKTLPRHDTIFFKDDILQAQQAIRERKTKYRIEDVSYQLNEYGFRGEWKFDDLISNSNKILILGCSVTFGQGIPAEHMWANILGTKLNNNYDLINLARPGSSLNKQLRYASLFSNLFKFQAIIFLLPNIYRQEIPVCRNSKFPDMVNLIPNFKDSLYKDLYDNYFNLVTDEQAYYDGARAMAMLDLIAKTQNVPYIVSSWDINTHQLLKQTCEHTMELFKWEMENDVGNMALDGSHPGQIHNERFANEVLNKLKGKL